MKKGIIGGGLFFIFALLIVAEFAFAAVNSTNSTNATAVSTSSTTLSNNIRTSSNEARVSVDKAYQCLENVIKNKTVSSMSLEEAIFTTLALGKKDIPQKVIESEKSVSAYCWPKSTCSIKSTAQVLFAQKRAGVSTDNIEKWLMSNNGTSTDLNWYLEIDISDQSEAECTLKYDSTERKINIREDMKISGNPGSCFSLSPNGYWLLVRENCYDKNIEISCNEDFISTLIYEKKNGETLYVLPNTHSAAALGTTDEKVSVKCFKTGAMCDYEGSLWAALALHNSGKNIDAFVPYLIALSDTNKKYFSSAFLYALIGAEDKYSDIVQSQKQTKYWKMINTPYNEYYDTSLAMLALTKSSSIELENAKNYLISIQGRDGCWNNGNIRDTAFLLYSGWPKAGSAAGTSSTSCESVSGQSCENSFSCVNAGGNVLQNFECPGVNKCCSISIQQDCSEKNGLICPANKQCTGNTVPSSDSGVCCVGSCVDILEENTCEVLAGNTCRSSCLNGEEEDSAKTCLDGDVCCIETEQASEGNWNWLIILLIILIILVLLSIIFRNQIKIWWFKFKGRVKVSPVVRPTTPPAGGYRMAQPVYRPARPISQGAPRRMPLRSNRPMNEQDKELEETLRKLREMSK